MIINIFNLRNILKLNNQGSLNTETYPSVMVPKTTIIYAKHSVYIIYIYNFDSKIIFKTTFLTFRKKIFNNIFNKQQVIFLLVTGVSSQTNNTNYFTSNKAKFTKSTKKLLTSI